MGSGDEVTFSLREASAGQLVTGSPEEFAALDPARLMPLNGPVRVDGAVPATWSRSSSPGSRPAPTAGPP